MIDVFDFCQLHTERGTGFTSTKNAAGMFIAPFPVRRIRQLQFHPPRSRGYLGRLPDYAEAVSLSLSALSIFANSHEMLQTGAHILLVQALLNKHNGRNVVDSLLGSYFSCSFSSPQREVPEIRRKHKTPNRPYKNESNNRPLHFELLNPRVYEPLVFPSKYSTGSLQRFPEWLTLLRAAR